MALVARLLEKRASLENPSTSLADPAHWLFDAFGATKSVTGRGVNERTALAASAVYACVRIISETLASLPLIVYERLEDGGKRPAPEHPVHALLHDRPNPEMTSFAYRETKQAHVLTWGNAYAEIERDGAGRPVALWPLLPDRTGPKRTEGGRAYFETHVNGSPVAIPAENVLHVPGLSWDGVKGYSPIRLAREPIGLSLATEEFGGRFFGNGMRASGMLRHPGRLSDVAHQNLQESFEGRYSGLTNSHRMMILEEGMDFTPTTLPPEDSQFLETRTFQKREIASIFRVPPHMLADLADATFSNVEQQSLDFVIHTMRPWLVRWEQVLNWQLFTPAERLRFFVEFKVEGLLRGDLKSRYDAYAVGRMNGWLSANDIRALENMNPIDSGAMYLVPLNMIPADQVGAVAPSPDDGTARKLLLMPRESRARRSMDARRRLQQSYRQLFLDPARRVVRREVQALRAAIKRFLADGQLVAFDDWVTRFYPDHEDYVARTLRPFFRVYAEAVHAEAAQELGEDPLFSAHLATVTDEFAALVSAANRNSSIGQLRGLVNDSAAEELEEILIERIDEWDEKRPDKIALRESVTLGGLISLESYWERGIQRKRWVTFGENCPLCESMRGRVVGIRDAFLGSGEELAPEGVQPLTAGADVIHPQLHGGCDCGIVAD